MTADITTTIDWTQYVSQGVLDNMPPHLSLVNQQLYAYTHLKRTWHEEKAELLSNRLLDDLRKLGCMQGMAWETDLLENAYGAVYKFLQDSDIFVETCFEVVGGSRTKLNFTLQICICTKGPLRNKTAAQVKEITCTRPRDPATGAYYIHFYVKLSDVE